MPCFPISLTHTSETRKSFFFPLFNIGEFPPPRYGVLILSFFILFLKVMNTFLMGILQGLQGKTSLVLGSAGKQYSPPIPIITTVS